MAKDNLEEHNEDFATLFENSISEMDSLEPGQQIETTIVSISGDSIFLELSGKSEGVLDSAELTDADGNVTVEEGDTIKVFFLYTKNGEKHFTTKISGEKAGNAVLEQAYESKIPVEGTVEKEIKGGFEVKIGETRAFCPYSQMGLKRIEKPEEYIGKQLTFKILEYSKNGRNILVSNRVILEEEQQQRVEELKETLQEDMVITGTIKSVQDFGAFVDLGGVQALLPISEISRSRVDDIRALFSEGEEIEAKIIKLDWQSERITLSMKALLPDPWDEAPSKYPVGSKHTGEVVRITSFGAFVTLEPGLDGLLHISELKGDSRQGNQPENVKKGQKITVAIKSLDTERKRIGLKRVSSTQEDENFQKYLDSETGNEAETYNPFADLLKDDSKDSDKG